MNALRILVFDHLVADPQLAALVGTYQATGAAARSAIFTTMPPEDLAKDQGYIVSTGNVSDIAVESKTVITRDVIRDIRIWFPNFGDPGPCELCADRVVRLFNRPSAFPALPAPITRVVLSSASGPIENDEDDFYGRVVTARFVLEEARWP